MAASGHPISADSLISPMPLCSSASTPSPVRYISPSMKMARGSHDSAAPLNSLLAEPRSFSTPVPE